MNKYIYDIIKEMQEYGNSFIITSKNKLEQATDDMKLKKKVSSHIGIYEASKDKEEIVYVVGESKGKIRLDGRLHNNIDNYDDIKYLELNDITITYESLLGSSRGIADSIDTRYRAIQSSTESITDIFSKVTEEIVIKDCNVLLISASNWFRDTFASKVTIEDCNFSNTQNIGIDIFKGAKEVEEIIFRNNKFTLVNSLNHIFSTCKNLRKLDISNNKYGKHIETSNYTFKNCSRLKEIIGLDTINFSYCKEMQEMFAGCSNLSIVRLNFKDKTSIVTMYGAFTNCYILSEISLENFDFKAYCKVVERNEAGLFADVPFNVNLNFGRQLSIDDEEICGYIAYIKNWLKVRMIYNDEQLRERNYTSNIVKRITINSIENNIDTFKIICHSLIAKIELTDRFTIKQRLPEAIFQIIDTIPAKLITEEKEELLSKIVECNDTLENWYKMFNYKQNIMGIKSIILDLAICIMVIDCNSEDYTIYLVDR